MRSSLAPKELLRQFLCEGGDCPLPVNSSQLQALSGVVYLLQVPETGSSYPGGGAVLLWVEVSAYEGSLRQGGVLQARKAPGRDVPHLSYREGSRPPGILVPDDWLPAEEGASSIFGFQNPW